MRRICWEVYTKPCPIKQNHAVSLKIGLFDLYVNQTYPEYK